MVLRRIIARTLVVVIVCLVGRPAPIDAGERTRVAVVVASTVNISAGEHSSLVSALGRGLEARLPVRVLAQETVASALPDGVPHGCLNQKACVRLLLSTLRAEHLLVLSLVRVGTVYQVQATAVDPATGHLTPLEQIALDADADLRAAFADKAHVLLPHLAAADPAPSGRTMTRGVWIASGISVASLTVATVFAARAYSRQGDCEDVVFPRLCSNERLDAIERDALVADIGFGLALGAAVTAGIFYYTSAPDDSRPMVVIEDGRVLAGWAGRF